MSFINQNSYIITCALILVLMASVLFRDGIRLLDIAAITVAIATFSVSWILLRPTPSTLSSIDSVEAVLENGEIPTLLDFQSEY